MISAVEKIADEIKSLPKDQLDEFLSWLADYEVELADEWDKELERDSQHGRSLQKMLGRVRKDIAAGNLKPLDEVADPTM